MKNLIQTLNESTLKSLVKSAPNVILDAEDKINTVGYLKQSGAVGSFGIPNTKNADYTIYPLNFNVNYKLNSDEVIVLSNTDKSRSVGNVKFMVKLNLKKSLVYFLDENSADDPIFDSKGIKMSYIRFYEPAL